MQILEKLKPLGLLWLRVTLAIVFFYAGYQKLFAATPEALRMFPRMGFPSYFAYIAGTLELFGAILLVLGLFTRMIALLLAIEMGIVLAKVVIPSAGIHAVPAYQLPLVLCGGTLVLATVGAGLFSMDAATFERPGQVRARGKK